MAASWQGCQGAGGAIVPAIVCSGTQAQKKGIGTGTKWHMAQGSRGVRQEPSGIACGLASPQLAARPA